jgi:hypothetical protein
MNSAYWKSFCEGVKIDSSPLCYFLAVVTMIIVLATPSRFLHSKIAEQIIGFELSILPKLKYDLVVIEKYSSTYLASRYVFLYLVSEILFVPLMIYCVIFARQGTMHPHRKPLNLNVNLLVMRCFATIFFAYFLFFDFFTASSSTRVARAIFHGSAFVFWVPGLFLALTNLELR